MIMGKYYVSFSLAKELKEKGFPQVKSTRCCYFVGDNVQRCCEVGDMIPRSKQEHEKHLIAAPSISEVLRWLRDVKKLHIQANPTDGGSCWYYQVCNISSMEYVGTYGGYKCYEDAIIGGIQYTINNLV